IDDVVTGGRMIEAGAHEIVLRVLEGASQCQLATETKKEWTRVTRETIDQMASECREINVITRDKRGHTGPALGSGNRHAIDSGVLDAGERTDRLGYLRG